MASFRPRIAALLGIALRLLPLPLLASPLLFLLHGGAAALAAPASPAQLQALEVALNSADEAALAALLQSGPGLDPAQLQTRRRQLLLGIEAIGGASLAAGAADAQVHG
ncbi:MAG: hypothetical protein ACKO25_10985, partial [Cyanobium sp.]